MSKQEIRAEIRDLKTPQEWQKYINGVASLYSTDYEAAHSKEDELKSRALQLVVSRRRNARTIAEMVLKMDEWDVPRYTA